MGVYWDYINDVEKREWQSLTSDHRLERFKHNVTILESLNTCLDKTEMETLRKFSNEEKKLNQKLYRKKIRVYLGELKSYEQRLMAKYSDHLSNSSFPGYWDKFLPIYIRAKKAL